MIDFQKHLDKLDDAISEIFLEISDTIDDKATAISLAVFAPEIATIYAAYALGGAFGLSDGRRDALAIQLGAIIALPESDRPKAREAIIEDLAKPRAQ